MKGIQILIIVMITGCMINTYEDKFGYSFSIEDSKNRGVFEKLFIVKQNVKINDSLNFRINNCFLESEWIYGKKIEESNAVSGSQLIIECEESQFMEDYLFRWIILYKNDLRKSIGKVGKSSFYIDDFEEVPSVLDFYVFKGDEFVNDAESFNRRLLGEFSIKLKD